MRAPFSSIRGAFQHNTAPVVIVLTAVLTAVLLTGCAWSLVDSPAEGTLRISLAGADEIGVLDLGDTFFEVTFFVVDADHFRKGGRTIRLGPNGDSLFEGPFVRTQMLNQSIVNSTTFSLATIDVIGGSDQTIALPGGSARYIGGNAISGVSFVEIENLAVGREYVVWIDAVRFDDPEVHNLGFGTVRIRSGAPSTITINLTEDRFPQFVDMLYDGYVKPYLRPVNLGLFSSVLYAGTGSASVAVDDGFDPWFDSPDYNRALVARLALPEADINIFFLVFYDEFDEFGGDASLVVYLFEQEGVLEPSLTSYGMALFDPELMEFSFPAGTIAGVDGFLEDGPEFYMEFLTSNPPVLSQAGFSGGGPSNGGTFNLSISGPGYIYGEGEDPAVIEISNLIFTFGPVLEAFEGFEFDGDFSYREPQSFVIDYPIDWYSSVDDLEFGGLVPQLIVGDQLTLTLDAAPPGYADNPIVWGTDIYSDDSQIGGAAVHAGALTLAGGTVTLSILPGQDFYEGSTRNGITTTEWDTFWYRSYEFLF